MELQDLVIFFHENENEIRAEIKGKVNPTEHIFQRRSLAFWVIWNYLNARDIRDVTQCQVYKIVDMVLATESQEEEGEKENEI